MSAGTPAVLDRRRPPAAAARRPFRFPHLERRSLAGGLELLLAPLPGRGLVELDLVCPGGGQHESAAEGGLAALTASLLDEGTPRASALEIAAELERIGGSLSTSADWDATYLSADVPADHTRRALELLAELVREASFPEREIERLRRQRLTELRRRSAQPAYLASVQLARAIYGDGVYGHSLLGSEASVTALDREAIVRFARRHVSPAGAALVAVGEFDPEPLAALCDRLLSTWKATGPPPSALAPTPTGEATIWLLDRPAAMQTELRCGQAGIPRRHPDFAALQVLNSVLGGKFTSRLNLSLRERHGVTYGAYSRVSGRAAEGPIVLGAAVANEAVGLALAEIRRELGRLRDAPVEGRELTDTRDYLLGVFPYSLQTVGGIGRRIETLAVHGLGDDYYDRYLGEIEAITPERLLDCARRHLRPEQAAAVAVGPAELLRPQLEPLGEVVVVESRGGSGSDR